MKNQTILKGSLFLAMAFGGNGISQAKDVECTKITSDLCTLLKQATSDSDTFSVSVNYFPPASDTSQYCRGLGPSQYTDDYCLQIGYNPQYYAKLKSDADTMYANFELWDAKNPTVRLISPDSGTKYHRGIVATKATLIGLNEEVYVSSIEDWEDFGPAQIKSRAMPKTEKSRSGSGYFLPDGRTLSAPGSVKRPYFFKK